MKAPQAKCSLPACGHMTVREILAGRYSGKGFTGAVGDMPLRESSEVISIG